MVETRQFDGYPNLPNFGFRVRFESGLWSGWHKGYHTRTDAEKAAWKAIS